MQEVSTLARTASDAILEQLASERRRVVSDWRALVLLRRATFALPPTARRWTQLPATPQDMRPILRRMVVRGELRPLPRLRHVFEVIVPYARLSPVSEDEILMELQPYAALSHISALAFHGLTDQLPQTMIVMAPKDGRAGMLPPDTRPQDWVGLDLIPGRKVDRILGQPVRWIRVKPERYFGVGEYQPLGYTVRVTTPERTLLDGLLDPEASGGLENVLHAWTIAQDTLDIEALVHQAERFGVAVLRQRVGFVMEALDLHHPMLDRWQATARRGGSSKLLASAPYSDTYSERWNLSLNASIDSLRPGGP